jgi:hypothetical protein
MRPGKIWIGWGGLLLIILVPGGTEIYSLLPPTHAFKITTIAQAMAPEPADETPPPKRKVATASLLIGRALYVYEGLGTTGKSCQSCHQLGQDTLGQPWKRKPDEAYMGGKMSLVKAINFCITNHQGGTTLSVNGSEMKSLVLYVSSLQ